MSILSHHLFNYRTFVLTSIHLPVDLPASVGYVFQLALGASVTTGSMQVVFVHHVLHRLCDVVLHVYEIHLSICVYLLHAVHC